MDGGTLARIAAERTNELPGAELSWPFGEGWDVYKVRGRVFLLVTEVRGEAMVIAKAAPADARMLRESNPAITPGYHMNKKHWISLTPGLTLDRQLVEDLVTESYLLVVEKLPRRDRPVDPETFGQ